MTLRSHLSSRHGVLRALALGALWPACATPPAAAPADVDAAPPAEATAGAQTTCTGPRGYNVQKNAYFGDLHTHTTYSYDAYTFNTRTTPVDGYRFAKSKGLDFAAITDHSEWLAIDWGCGAQADGVTPIDPNSPIFNQPRCKTARSTNPLQEDINFANSFNMQQNLCGGSVPRNTATCGPIIRDAWSSEIAAATAANDPCTFTSFIGYEWTNNCTGDGGSAATCHKNVIFGDDNVPASPFDSLAFPTQESLWAALDVGCSATGSTSGPCNALTIPHNSNLSNGQAFSVPPGSEAHAQKYQRLVEIFQHKGGSECFFDPTNSGGDPDCNFNYMPNKSDSPTSYVRSGLEAGLVTQAQTHQDTLQLGIVGATDDHNGQPGNTQEDTWAGHLGRLDNTPGERLTNKDEPGTNPGGVAVAWAEQNTRDAIFAAFQRRETYATSGPRLTVRMYQTWDQTTDFCADPSFPTQILAAGGQPMGSTVAIPPGATGAPRIVVFAARDASPRADAANLDEVDLVEAWVDPTAGVQERVLRAASNTNGGLPTVCRTFTLNPAGQAPAFTAGVPSLFYARVLQVPTERWSHYDCVAAPGTSGCAAGGGLDVTIRERAWTSPIWYLP